MRSYILAGLFVVVVPGNITMPEGPCSGSVAHFRPFSKKIENHMAAVALGYFAYNFIKIHRTLRVTPAMAA